MLPITRKSCRVGRPLIAAAVGCAGVFAAFGQIAVDNQPPSPAKGAQVLEGAKPADFEQLSPPEESAGSDITAAVEPFSDDPPGEEDAIAGVGSGAAQFIGTLKYMTDFGPAFAEGAEVQVWDRDYLLSGDDLLATGIVRSDGSFEVTFGNRETLPWDRQDIYIRFIAENSAVRVWRATNTLVVGYTHNMSDDIADGVHNLGVITIDTGVQGRGDGYEGAFEICRQITRARRYFFENNVALGLVTVMWNPTSTAVRSYNPATRTITLPNGDQWDPSVIRHEYGHHLWRSLTGRTSTPTGFLGCSASWNHTNGDHAWYEGFAIWAGQRSFGFDGYGQNYFDRDRYGNVAVNVNIERETGDCYSSTVGTTCTKSVVAALWDISDNMSGDPHFCDTLALGPSPIMLTLVQARTINNSLQFRNKWHEQGRGNGVAFDSIFRQHRILSGAACSSALMDGDGSDEVDELDVNVDGQIDGDDVEAMIEFTAP